MSRVSHAMHHSSEVGRRKVPRKPAMPRSPPAAAVRTPPVPRNSPAPALLPGGPAGPGPVPAALVWPAGPAIGFLACTGSTARSGRSRVRLRSARFRASEVVTGCERVTADQGNGPVMCRGRSHDSRSIRFHTPYGSRAPQGGDEGPQALEARKRDQAQVVEVCLAEARGHVAGGQRGEALLVRGQGLGTEVAADGGGGWRQIAEGGNRTSAGRGPGPGPGP